MDNQQEISPYKILGDIFVCTDVACQYAKEHNIDSYNEMTLYVIHGLLHLIGYDDIEENDKKAMRKKEKSCIDLLRDRNLYNEFK